MRKQPSETIQNNPISELDLSQNTDDALVRPQDEPSRELPSFQPNPDILNLFTGLKKHLNAEPTGIPKNFWEQLQFVDDGSNKTLSAFINGAWQSFGLFNLNVAMGNSFSIINNNNAISITTGFRPKLIIALSAISESDYFSVGFAFDSSNNVCVYRRETGMAYIQYLIAAFDGTNGRYAKINAITDTGFTLAVTSDGAGLSPYYSYVAIG